MINRATKILLALAALALATPGRAQYVGVTCGFNYAHDLDGPISRCMNWPLYNPSRSNPNATWRNWVEELEASGVDFVCPNLRGSYPNNGVSPTNIAPLVKALNEMGLSHRLKIGLFDDNAASWTAQWNQAQGRQWAWAKPMDMGDTNNWRYLYDFNYKLFYETVPDANRFKVEGRPLMIIWTGDKDLYLTNMQGNCSRALMYARQSCQRDFGFNPYVILQAAFFRNDTTCNDPGVADGGEGWTDYNDSTTAPYTLTTIHGVKIGATMPGFKHQGVMGVNVPHATEPAKSCFKDPNHGLLLTSNLANTRGAGALVTLVEGFSDFEEDAALFAVRNLDPAGNPLTYDQTFYDYPNQRLNILRQWSNFPFPVDLKVEVENCDSFGGAAGGDGKTNYYRNGNIAIEPTTDQYGGWDVAWIQPGEWFEWRDLPIQGSQVHLQARVASASGGKLHFVIDGQDFPAMTVPNTGGNQTWTTIDSGKAFPFARNSRHTVRLVCDTGGFSVNYWQYHDVIPLGASVRLQAKAGDKWVAAGAGGALQAGASQAGSAQQFQVVDESAAYWPGVVALQSVATHRYVTADPSGAAPLAANKASTVGPNEVFQWIDNGDGTISLRSLGNYMAVTAAPTGLVNAAIVPGLPESFVVKTE